MTKTISSLLLIVVIIAFAPIGALATELKIMVVFSQGASQYVSVTDTFEDIQDYVEAKFSQAQITAPVFVQYPTFHNYFEQGLSANALLRIANVNPKLRQFRDENLADLLLFVVTGVNSSNQNACGAATGTTSSLADHSPNLLVDKAFGINNINLHKGFADLRFAAYVTLLQGNGCVSSPIEEIAAHEIGHLLFGEHEVTFDSQGNPNGEVGSNTDWDKPVQHNHPAVNGSDRTLMYSTGAGPADDFYSRTGAQFTNGNPASNQYAKFANYMDSVTYNYVAHYREAAPVANVEEPTCYIEYTGCVSNTEQWSLSWNNQAASPITDVFMEQQGGSNWYSAYSGDLVCAPLLVSASRVFRVLGVTQTLGYTDACLITIHGGSDCQDEEAW